MTNRINAVPALRMETSSREEMPFSSTTLLTLPLTANRTAAPMASSTPVEVRDDLMGPRCQVTGPCWPIRMQGGRAGSVDGHPAARDGDGSGMLRNDMSSTRSRPALTTGSPSASFRAPMCGLRAVESKPTHHIGLVDRRTVERPQDKVMDLGAKGRRSRGDSGSRRSGLSPPSGSASAGPRPSAGEREVRLAGLTASWVMKARALGETDVEIAAAVLAQHI